VDVIEPGAPAAGSSDDVADGERPSGGLDLSPREVETRRQRRRRGWWPVVVLVLVLVAAGYVVSKALTSASLFFYTADEAVAKRPELGNKDFRIEGTVLAGSVHRTTDGANFTIVYNCVEVPVDHSGDPPALFKPGEPVVLEGHWDPSKAALFDSDLMLVKHSGTYDAANPGRNQQAQVEGVVSPKCASKAAPGSSSSP
jgi:cytochrome c-type biogenesis protein CcmE